MADGSVGAGDSSSASDGSPNPDAADPFAWPTCGTQAFTQTELYYGHAIGVATDGTVFHAQYDGGENYVSRYRPGQPIERTWSHVGTGATSAGSIAVSPSGTPYALIRNSNDTTQLVRLDPTPTPIGAPVQTISGPTNLAFSHDGILFESSFSGLRRVDVTTGQRTPVSPAMQLREVYFVGNRTARGVTYDHGLVEITLAANATSSTFKTIFPFTTLALQYTGMDQMGRTYALIHEMSNDKLVRFDPTFATRETLVMYPSVSIVFGRIAFGRGALRCDVLVTGFNVGRVAMNDTAGVP
ncbi:MAG TPA: hypothetical protein VIV11_16425 [Kofleriaceae bacterium]